MSQKILKQALTSVLGMCVILSACASQRVQTKVNQAPVCKDNEHITSNAMNSETSGVAVSCQSQQSARAEIEELSNQIALLQSYHSKELPITEATPTHTRSSLQSEEQDSDENVSDEDSDEDSHSLKPKSRRCIQTCELESSICKSSGRICNLSEQMPDDSWAIQKCEEAKISCQDALKACKDCKDSEA